MTHGSLFSGIGGFDLAAEWMGWDNIFHCEINPFCNKILKHHWPNAQSYTDIKQFDGTIYRGTIDIISGGFPCQDISIAKQLNGQGKGINGERSGLWSEYARIVGEIRPKFVVFENSPMLVVRGFERVLCDLSRMGYDAEWRNFYATQFGFNHRRKKTYGVAYTSSIGFKDYIKKEGILRKILQKQPPRQNPLPDTFKRYGCSSSFDDIQLDDGFSSQLDKDSLMALGNAIVPQIAYEIFKVINTLHNATNLTTCQQPR